MQSDLKALEFDAVRRLLERLAATPYGAEAARELTPAPSLSVAREMQAAVSAARQAVDAFQAPRFGHIPDVRAALRQASQPGAALAATALGNLRATMLLGETLQQFVSQFPELYRRAENWQGPAELFELFERMLSYANRLRDDATPELQALHAELRGAQTAVEEALRARMREPDIAAAFDEKSRPHWHGARGVLAIRQSYVEQVKGVRRGTTGGGRDVLLEPMEVVALNNRLEVLSGQVEAQNQIALRAMTDRVREHLPQLNRLIDAIAWIDLALAAGQLSAAMNAAAPALVDAPLVRLRQAYHPHLLLQFRDKHIPTIRALDISIDAKQPMMVITGPNTGGKTVVLKTVGLLVTMAHCGLHIPSEGDCEIGDFSRVVVDVGDKQSLYHHLSTFAGHVEVLKRLLQQSDEKTLVLLDELGTGTDPEEGAALAMAVLDELARRGVHGIVTTHLPPLKAFAATHPYLVNASMRFDHASMTPTYELEPGVAGQSLGLLIAEKNGLPAELIANARAFLQRLG